MSLDVLEFSLNGDCGSYLDGQIVVCTIDKSEYKVAFSLMAQISKSDFGIFYGVVPVDGSATSSVNDKHSGASNRLPIYILPAVYVMVKKPQSSSGDNNGGGSGENGGGTGDGSSDGSEHNFV